MLQGVRRGLEAGQGIGKASPAVYANASRNDKKTTNAVSITLKKPSVTLKVGATHAIKASVKGMKSGVKVLARAGLLRYFSSNRNVATVNASGRPKGQGTGKAAHGMLQPEQRERSRNENEV